MLLKHVFSMLNQAVISVVVAQKPYAITGVPVDPAGPVPLRKNINDLEAAGGAQW